MKTYNIYTYILLLLVIFSSCEEQLDLKPVTSLAEDTFFNNAEEIEVGINGVYDGLQAGVMREFVLAEVRSDNTATLAKEGDFDMIDQFTESANNSVVTNYWIAQYNSIGRANKVLKYIDNSREESVRILQEAELRFLRAYCHFNLVRLFGGIPIIDEDIIYTDTDMFVKKSADEVLAFVEAELTYAADNLPAERTGDDLGRASSTAAKALLAQLYMFQGKQDQATLNLLDDVIGSYDFSIAYKDIFAISNEMNDEVVFAIRFTAGAGEGQDLGEEFTAKGEFSGLNNPTSDVLALYEEGDLRKAFTVSDEENPVLMKYAEDNTQDSEMDWVVIRRAEALLSRAEITANLASGVSQAAIDDINLLRKRAGLAEYTAADFADKTALLAAIEKERRIELLGENYRWYDLLRQGTAIDVMSDHLGKVVDEKYLLFPIPQREIDASQGVLTQNR